MPHEHEAQEAPLEATQIAEFKGEREFNPNIEWNQQVIDFIKASMGEKHGTYVNMNFLRYIETGLDYDKFKKDREDIVKMKLENGILQFLDDDNDVIASFDITAGQKEILGNWKEHDCDLCHRRSQRHRLYESRKLGFSDHLMRMYAMKNAKTREQQQDIVESPRPPLSPEELAENLRHQALMDEEKALRGDVLASVEKMDAEEYEFSMPVDAAIKNADRKELEKQWKFLDYSAEIDYLFQHDANPEEGYQINPFYRQKWTPEKLLKLIQDDKNDRLYFSDISDSIYSDRFDDFKKELQQTGVPDEVLDMLKDDLLESYKLFSKMSADLQPIAKPEDIPGKYKDIFKYRREIKQVTQILGDYIGYGNRIINLVGKLHYNETDKAEDHERTMLQGKDEASPEGHVKQALYQAFMKGVTSPREYEFNLANEEMGRPITFQDLNGQTATAESGDWLYQSPATAYKLALEAVEEQNAEKREKVFDEEKAKEHLNYLLQLGICAYSSMRSERSIKDTIDDLSDKGAKIRFTGRSKGDSQNLYSVLALTELKDMYKTDSEKDQLIARERLKFIRLGSVIYAKNDFLRERRESQKRALNCRFSEQQADDIIAQLRKANRFKEEELSKIKSTLIGGGVIVLPREGGAVGIHIPFENGVTIDITGAYPWAVGGAVGKNIEASEDFIISINVGGGYSFTGPAEGWSVGPGGSVTKKLESVDVSVMGGGGYLFGADMFVKFVGIGVDWGKFQENYEKTLKKNELEAGVAELSKTQDPYAAVKENPEKYPHVADLYRQIQSIKGLDETSRREMFLSAYAMFKESLQRDSIADSETPWYVPTGAGIGVAKVGPVFVPYAYLEFNIWKKHLVYRIASNVGRAEQISEEKAKATILENYKKTRSGEIQVVKNPLAVTGELSVDPETGNLKLIQTKENQVDFSHLDKFKEYQNELASNSKIFVEPAANGLMRLSLQEAYGNVEVYVDPELNEDVVAAVFANTNDLFLSIKKDTRIFIQRQDITYPFKERGAVEKTIITISKNPAAKTDTIQRASGMYIDRTPTREWAVRPRSSGKPQNNIKDERKAEFTNWISGIKIEDRVKPIDIERLNASYNDLVEAVSIFRDKTETDVKISPEVRAAITKLSKDTAFLNEFRRLSTQKYTIPGSKRIPVFFDWKEDLPELTTLIRTKLYAEGAHSVTPDELNAAALSFLSASFRNLQNKKDAAEQYSKTLDTFHRNLLTSIFAQYYETARDDKKVTDAVDWFIGQFQNIDIINDKPQEVEEGTMYGTLVGVGAMTGIRRHINYSSKRDELSGVIGKQTLDTSKTDTSGEIADFWVKKLSPYVRGLADTFDETKTDEHEKIAKNLQKPLAIKLVPVFGYILTPREREHLKQFYNYGGRYALNALTQPETVLVAKKFLKFCDRVRTAELNGEKEIWFNEKGEINESGPFKLELNLKVAIAIYKECGNPTGLVNEGFALFRKEDRYFRLVYAGMGESNIDVRTVHSRKQASIMLGAALPLPKVEEVKPREEKPPPTEQPPTKHPPTEQPPIERPTQPTPPRVPPTAEGIPPPEPQPAGGVGQGGGTGTGVEQAGGDAGGSTTSIPDGTARGPDYGADAGVM